MELWNLRVVEWRSEGEVKEEGFLRWIKEAVRVEFIVGLERGWWWFFFFFLLVLKVQGLSRGGERGFSWPFSWVGSGGR